MNRKAAQLPSFQAAKLFGLKRSGPSPLFSRAFVARRREGPWIQGARRKMDEGVLAVRQSHFSSATQ